VGVRQVKDESDLINLLTRMSDTLLYFVPKERGRPPRVNREHIEAVIILCKTLIDDIHKCLDYMLPDVKQIRDLMRAFEFLNAMKRRYINRINYLEKMGQVPPPEEEDDD